MDADPIEQKKDEDLDVTMIARSIVDEIVAQVDDNPEDDVVTAAEASKEEVATKPLQATAGPSLVKESSADSSTTTASTSQSGDDVYHVKWICYKSDDSVAIVTQNSNGPCPMLAIVNVLLLRGKIKLSPGCEVVSSEQLLERLGNTILETVPNDLSADRRLDCEANVGDAVILLPKLQTGIDVNVKFGGVADFEYTSECIIFDLFNIALYHGWLVDPQLEDIVKAINGLSYNQLVEKIVADKSSDDSDVVSASLTALNFLSDSASQLTYHGLCELNATIKEDELAIFFRNNHFSTIYKRNGELFLLVTDQGFLREPSVVWETLSSIDGDGHFVDAKFVTAPPKSSPKLLDFGDKSLSSEQQVDQDLQLAMTLEAQQKRDHDWEDFKRAKLGDTAQLSDEQLAKQLQQIEESAQPTMTDEELARQLQEAENNVGQPEGQPSQSTNQQNVAGSSSPRTRNCVIL